jgi:trigger factor
MQITETHTEGLKREFKVILASQDIERRVSDRLLEIGKTVRMPGFRPGKVPMTVLKKRYGSSVMGEVLEDAVNDSSTQAMSERGLRPATRPKIEIQTFAEGKDLEYTMAIELLPEIQPMNFSELELERLRPDVSDEELTEALDRLAQRHRKTEPVGDGRPAQTGDTVVIDFVGSIDGTEFPGGAAKDFSLELGSGRFIPGFEEQLVGVKAGDHVQVKVGFPEDYPSEDLKGKDAVFEVDVKELRQTLPPVIDDTLADAVGMENLEALKTAVREQMEREYGGIARQKVKRQLLDALASRHDFPVPATMLDAEFDAIWKQYEEERARLTAGRGEGEAAEAAKPEGEKPEAEKPEAESGSSEDGKSDEEAKAEYRQIAERRVRLGLLLSEVGRLNNIQVSQEELNQALIEEARRHQGYEKQVFDYYRKNPDALASLRAPIYEEKVVDFILEMAKVTEKAIKPADLLKAMEDEPEATEA